MKGKCLCGSVEFEVVSESANLYQCHCSLCQKSSGSSCSSSVIVGINDVKWIRGNEKISSYTKENGFRTDFCSVCGSPVPNKMNIGPYICVPAGSLEGSIGGEIVAHIHTGSKASWERNAENCKTFTNTPEDLDDFIHSLNID
ncbi:MAG: hypothetical protein AMJ53_11695 [Gammaproteobacteria bacterium SG8_11]|nr:MAG: hypothetical protein AMJ53_11695 [Gammaproteobacteria bacterium SG8_11]